MDRRLRISSMPGRDFTCKPVQSFTPCQSDISWQPIESDAGQLTVSEVDWFRQDVLRFQLGSLLRPRPMIHLLGRLGSQ
jgi:hypothetical protein